MVTFPEAKNKLLIRIENNADIYDPDATTRFVDLNQLAYALYQYANNNYHDSLPALKIEELSLSANMPIDELRQRKIQWRTRDDEALDRSGDLDQEEGAPVVSLVPQKIKVFSIEFAASDSN